MWNLLFILVHEALLEYDFTTAVGQIVLDKSGNSNDGVSGTALGTGVGDPVFTDREMYIYHNPYLTLPTNKIHPL